VVNPKTPLLIQAAYGIEIAVVVSLWFTSLVFILSTPFIKTYFSKFNYYIEKGMGAILIALGIKVALSSHK
jgi:threonine/homoserine/homoserine lactone efflux protein